MTLPYMYTQTRAQLRHLKTTLGIEICAGNQRRFLAPILITSCKGLLFHASMTHVSEIASSKWSDTDDRRLIWIMCHRFPSRASCLLHQVLDIDEISSAVWQLTYN